MSNMYVPIYLKDRFPCRIQRIEFTNISMHWHNSLEYILSLSDGIKIVSSGYTGELKKGDLIINNIGEQHQVSADRESNLICIQIPEYMLSNYFSAVHPEIEKDQFAISLSDKHMPHYQEMQSLILELNNEKLNPNPDYLRIYANTFRLLSLTEHYCRVGIRNGHQPNLKDSIFAGIIFYIQDNYKRPISRNDLGKLSNYSPQYISQLFKKNTGMTIKDYINSLRLESARRELIFSNKTIMDIAIGNGFSSTKYFNHLFMEKYSIRARDYRLKNKETSLPPKSDPQIPDIYGYHIKESNEFLNPMHDYLFNTVIEEKTRQIDFQWDNENNLQLFTWFYVGDYHQLRKAKGRIELNHILNTTDIKNIMIRIGETDISHLHDLRETLDLIQMSRKTPHVIISPRVFEAFISADQIQHFQISKTRICFDLTDNSLSDLPAIEALAIPFRRNYGIAFAPYQSHAVFEYRWNVTPAFRICLVQNEKDVTASNDPSITFPEGTDLLAHLVSDIDIRDRLKLHLDCLSASIRRNISFSMLHPMIPKHRCDSLIFFEEQIKLLKEYNHLRACNVIQGFTDHEYCFIDITSSNHAYTSTMIPYQFFGLPKGQYIVQTVSINHFFGNALDAYNNLGLPDDLPEKVSTQVSQMYHPYMQINLLEISPGQTVTLTVPVNAVNFFTLIPI